jgi:hypothetical protein
VALLFRDHVQHSDFSYQFVNSPIVSNDIYQKIPGVARPTLTSTNQEVLTASGDKLTILGRGNFLMRLDDTQDMVVQALVAQITVEISD